MQTLSAFYPFIRPKLSNVPDLVLERAVLDTCIQFAEESNIVSFTLGPISTTPTVAEYVVPLPPQVSIGMVDKAWLGTRHLGLTAPQYLNDPTAVFGTVGSDSRPVGTPRSLYIVDDTTVGLYPAPDADNAKPLSLTLSVRPLITATQVDDVLLTDWPEYIAAGVIWRVASQPGQIYTNLELAASSLMLFSRGVQRARNRSYKGRVVSNAMIQQRPFA